MILARTRVAAGMREVESGSACSRVRVPRWMCTGEWAGVQAVEAPSRLVAGPKTWSAEESVDAWRNRRVGSRGGPVIGTDCEPFVGRARL